jgi:putative membrane protein
MNTKNLTIKTAALCLGLFLGTACSNDSEAPGSKEHAEEVNEENLNREGEKDADRLTDLYGLNLFEVKVSEEAVNKCSTADAKNVASMMVQAHTKMTADLQQLASRKGITLPGELSNDLMRDMDKLNEKTGLDYDKEYLDQMKNKHEDGIDKLEKTADKAEDAEIKDMASKSLPEMRSHLDMVEAARNKVKDVKSDARDNDKDHKDGHNDHDGHNH